MKIFSGNANPQLAKEICKFLNIKLGSAFIGKFSEGEVRVRLGENVRGKDVFIIQPTCPPVNDNLMELLVMVDAVRRSSAKRITAVIPYFGYARQDRKDMPRVPITAKLVANILTAAGVNRVLTIDLHASQIQGFFDIPLDHLFAVKVLMEYFQKKKIKNLVVVSPDVGGIKMARAYAKRINASLAIVDKRRVDDKEAEAMNILGEVKGKNAVLVDDMIATAGSLVEAAQALKKAGAKDIYAAATHPVLSGPAVERIKNSVLKELLVTNTIPINDSKKLGNKIKVLSVAPLLAEAIKRIHNEESVSCLFD
ncbi:MAG: phosphoribosylpyrophosphate synthetase [Candidatus Omnitrophica bacterium CG12_big_fil_rev_8_21_14_0_65_43_15]|uniref:Ribose-phosphate pyrophosphokinase n=1 Tax=Candidatus Taenaricola geysiri TaxID=1974752 RepID=A0A2J0LGB8_9BACT|nr:MAG: phosphoribosylpyrophosphate synthetase [Candidatus Omnitrophica bacterium CG1_02_43_210]PIR66026.1 MAG: phosphoribosylpyrophosphate synthetase [Candidatus Omnitrophica bacterium CG10_big_fil_rev_8_21_14_0_10_43_8]PIV11713.1 MAG: phosphoribosylpyrophosphate synthetase [Candidatus Omnitrophica bacterium CG03_land_8_20_14_0_80_43_22]PIW66888.1 MAG: phosphoribosylpyrophosphate synthetase [Candidatus Omnitrophica bacterium CG12_big_fil_rev_8_21_14_0_65_43_15]PIW80627.1 MAG: phosphoribosylpyr